MTTIQEQIALLQAVADGKTLQFTSKAYQYSWKDADTDWHDRVKAGVHSIEVGVYNWRIKPEPRVIWVNEYSNNQSQFVHFTEASAKANASIDAVRVAVKYQEVL